MGAGFTSSGVGVGEGLLSGAVVGVGVGVLVGEVVGVGEEVGVGTEVGLDVGLTEGFAVGLTVGLEGGVNSGVVWGVGDNCSPNRLFGVGVGEISDGFVAEPTLATTMIPVSTKLNKRITTRGKKYHLPECLSIKVTSFSIPGIVTNEAIIEKLIGLYN